MLKYVEKNNIKNIIMTGQIGKKELSDWISSAELCMFTTLNNLVQRTSCPNKIYDYIVHKKPILIDLDMWILEKYGDVIFKVNFNEFSYEDLNEIRNFIKKINTKSFDKYILNLKRNQLVNKFKI